MGCRRNTSPLCTRYLLNPRQYISKDRDPWSGSENSNIGNLAVLAGLIFLALEIQQNSNAIRASAVQEAKNVARTQILMYVQDAEVNRLGTADYDSLSPEDEQRRFWLDRSFWLGMQGLYRQSRLGVFPEEEWATWYRIICANYARRIPELWSRHASTLASDFIAMVEGCDVDRNVDLPN